MHRQTPFPYRYLLSALLKEEKNSNQRFDIVVMVQGDEPLVHPQMIDNAINEIGCIHTSQGYDLNYCALIFGHEISYNKEINEIIINEDMYFDKNGKRGIKNKYELKSYIINIYKTMLLRAVKGTYIYVCDKDLKEYLSNYIIRY